MNYLGWMNCKKCIVGYITDPAMVTIWYNADDSRPLAEARCHCGELKSYHISLETFLAFRSSGVVVKNFNDKFDPLTEEEIEAWDIESELQELK